MAKVPNKQLTKFIEKMHGEMPSISKKELKLCIRNNWSTYKVSELPTFQYIAKKWMNDIVLTSIINKHDKIDIIEKEIESYINSVDVLKLSGARLENFQDRIKTLRLQKEIKIDGQLKKTAIIQSVIDKNKERIKNEELKNKKEILSEIDSEIQKKIRENEEASELILSIENLEFEDFEDEIDERTWWQKLGLRVDPFNKNGLNDIQKKDFDNILVETNGIKFAKSFRTESGKFNLGSNYMLSGDYGVGKSCVMDYIMSFADDINIIPLKVNLHKSINLHLMLQKFYKQLYRSILKINGSYDQNIMPDEESCIISIKDMIDSRLGAKGVVILIDDLHKAAEKDIPIAIDFISALQSFHQELKEYEVNSSMIFTGFPNWKDRFLKSPKITSVISPSDIIDFPPVQQKHATSAIKRRFECFSINGNNFPINDGYVKELVTITDINKNSGFRLYFDTVKEKLENGENDVFTLDPIVFPTHVIEASKKIRNAHHLSSNLYKMIKSKIGRSEVPISRQNIIKVQILGHICQNKYITEDDILFNKKNNIHALKHLNRFGLVRREGKNKWHIVKGLDELDHQLKLELNVPLSTALSNWYILTDNSSQKIEVEKDIYNQIVPDFDKWEQAVKALADSGYEMIQMTSQGIKDYIVPPDSKVNGYKNIDHIKIMDILEDLASIILLCEDINILDIEKNISDQMRLRPWSIPSSYDAFLRSYSNKDKLSNNQKKSFLQEVKHVIPELQNELIKTHNFLVLLSEGFNKNGAPLFKIKDLDDDLLVLRGENIDFEFFCEILVLTEGALRSYFWIKSSLLYGNLDERAIIWKRVISGAELKRMVSHAEQNRFRLGEDYNEYQSLQRKGFKVLMEISQKESFYNEISHPLLEISGGKQDFDIKIDNFEKYDIESTHNKTYDLKEKIRTNVGMLRSFIGIIVNCSSLIIQCVSNAKVVRQLDQTYKVSFSNRLSNMSRYFDYSDLGVSDKKYTMHDEIKSWKVIEENIDKYMKIIFSQKINYNIIDLNDYNTIRTLFGVQLDYGLVIAYLIFFEFKEKIAIKVLNGTNLLLMKN